jgi:hypothetical protein
MCSYYAHFTDVSSKEESILFRLREQEAGEAASSPLPAACPQVTALAETCLPAGAAYCLPSGGTSPLAILSVPVTKL